MSVTSKQGIVFNAVSMAESFESDPIDILHFKEYSASFFFTGSPAGTLKIQISNDTPNTAAANTSWIDLENSSSTIAAAGSIVYEVTEANTSYIKFVFTRTSGTGVMTGRITAKG